MLLMFFPLNAMSFRHIREDDLVIHLLFSALTLIDKYKLILAMVGA